ncbi:MAG: hypothetical protein K2X27_05985 [Candidatus Obscuribacterales bacterium]|nr:hypothetical protein [Candidatus Obscuribacterales bacterium]
MLITLEPNKRKLEAFFQKFSRLWRKRDREHGQGIVEYACLIALTTILIAFFFGYSSGTLLNAMSQSRSRMVGELDRINSETNKY